MLISRRTAIARGAALLAGLYTATTATSADAASTGVAYKLKTGAHCHCKACEHHAANKLFATRRAANNHRAHEGCKCTIVRVKVDPTTWAALFSAHTVVDRRWSSTKQSLRRAAAKARAAKATKAKATKAKAKAKAGRGHKTAGKAKHTAKHTAKRTAKHG